MGNIISQPTRAGGTRTLSYFANGQVKEIKDGNGNDAIFRYDAFGAVQQLVLTGNTPDTRHDQHFGGLITKHDEVVAGTRKSVLTRSIPGPGVVATRHGPTATPTATWTFAFGDERGNRFFTDQNGGFVQDVDYQPYGEAKSTGAQPGAPTYTSAQWNGGDALAALGLSQLGARFYDPIIGRFLSRDPLFIPRTAATTNPYAFAMNDPVNSSDPSGLDSLGDFWNLCPECRGHEVINIDGGHWDPETENHPFEGDGATGVGAFTYPEPSNPVVPPFVPKTYKWGSLPTRAAVDLYNKCQGDDECFRTGGDLTPGEALALSAHAYHDASVAAEMNLYAYRALGGGSTSRAWVGAPGRGHIGSSRGFNGVKSPSAFKNNVKQVGNDFTFRKMTDAAQVEAVVEHAAKNGATEIHVLSNAHGYPGRNGQYEISEHHAGWQPLGQAYRTFYSEDAAMQGRIMARYPNATVYLHDALDPSEFAAHSAARARGQAGDPGVVTVGGLCFSCKLPDP